MAATGGPELQYHRGTGRWALLLPLLLLQLLLGLWVCAAGAWGECFKKPFKGPFPTIPFNRL
jgi:hypothetical protein